MKLSFKTIKIAVLSGLMLNSAMPVQAGLAEIAKSAAKKFDKFIWKKPVRALGLLAASAAAGAGIGLLLDKRTEKNNKQDKALINQILASLRDKDGSPRYIIVNLDTNQLANVKEATKTSLRQLIENYHTSLRFGNYPAKEIAHQSVVACLENINSFELASNKLPYGMLIGAYAWLLLVSFANDYSGNHWYH